LHEPEQPPRDEALDQPSTYLTTGMPPSRGGDSGAPVWAVGDDGRVQVLGIWLGGRTTADGHDYGRFAALSSAVSALGITSAD
jgi:hypothetical protein